MFLQSNTQRGKREARGRGGGPHKGLSYFLCHLRVLSAPSHYIMSEIVNKQITTVHHRPHWERPRGAFHSLQLPNSICFFIVHFILQKKRLSKDLSEYVSMAKISIYGTCHSQDAEVSWWLFMMPHPIMAYHSLNGTQQFTSEY